MGRKRFYLNLKNKGTKTQIDVRKKERETHFRVQENQKTQILNRMNAIEDT